MIRALPALLVLLAAPPAALAQADAAAKGPRKTREAVLEAFGRYEKAQAALREVTAAQSAAVRNAAEADRDAARAASTAALEAPRKAANESRATFVAAFAQSDWNVFDPKADQKILETGLFEVGREEIEDDPALARRAFTALLEKAPAAPQAASVRTYFLPTAFAASGAIDEGIGYLQGALDEAPETDRPAMRVAIGDLLAATGKGEAARAEYQGALEAIPETLEERDPRSRAKADAELRLALVGLAPPDIDSETWIGDAPKALSAMRGKVVVVDFWATWCGPCRHVMPALNELYNERKDEGLVVLGVTRVYDNGYLPASPDQMQSGGASVRGMDEAAFLEHVKAFKANTGIEYPFVVAEQADFQNYKIRGIPTVVVLDAEGKVTFVGIGSGSEPGVRAAVDYALRRAKKG